MSASPLVSVVIPTYNRSALLVETVASIRNQTFADFELIVVDNVSQDDTEQRLAALGDPRIRYIRNANHGVIAVNRNLGISRAVGRYVAFCDDDDLWMPEKLSRQVAVMERDPAVGLCYTNGSTFRDGMVVHERMVARRIFESHFRHLMWDNCIPSSSVMVRREVFAHVGMIDESPSLVAVEDYEMWLRIAARTKLVFLDDVLIRYRLHGRSAGLRPAAVSLRNVLVLKSVRRKLGMARLPVFGAILRQYAKHVYFRAVGR